MKSSVKLSIAFVLSISLLFSCSLLLWNAEADFSLQKVSLGNDAVRIQTDQATPVPVVDVQLLENTDQCLADCYAILKFHPYQDMAIPPQTNSEFAWNFEKEKPWMDGLVSHHFELLETTEYKVDIPEYGKTFINTTCYHEDNSTYECEVEQTVQTGSHQETRYRNEYKPFAFWGETLKANQDYTIKLVGKKRLHLFVTNNIDWIPTIKGLDLNDWAWWNSSWKYKQSINVSMTSNVTGYQLKIVINESNNGSHWDWTNECSGKFRIVNKDENETLPFWIEECSVSGKNITFWFNGSFNVNNGTQAYIYYGNPYASSGSNGTLTFPFFDDFEYSDSPSNHGWSLTNASGGNISVNNSFYKTGSQSLLVKTNGNTHALNISSGWGNSSLECWFLDNGDYDGGFTEINVLQYDNTTDGVYVGIDESEVHYNYSYRFYTPGQQYDTKKARSNGWHSLRITYNDSRYYVWVDDVYYNSTDKLIAQPTRIVLGFWWANQYAQNWFDAVRVRKYLPQETAYSLGLENDGCPSDDTYINENTKFEPGNIFCNVPDGDNEGVLIINASNIILDCNGMTLNGMDSGIGIYNDGFDNVTIKNCNVNNYNKGIEFENNADNNTIYSNTLYSNIDLEFSFFAILVSGRREII